MVENIRINKYLSESGYCSRRKADELVAGGHVKINGIVCEIGARVFPEDFVEVDGREISSNDRRVVIAYNKPIGIECTSDVSNKDNIIKAVNYPSRVFTVGRLDKNSCGLILLTNDGDLANNISKAGQGHEKEYIVKVDKKITEDFIFKMSDGVPVLDKITAKCTVKKINDYTFSIILIQGLNRQIRRMCEYLGYKVTFLKRIRIMNIKLGDIQIGKYRELTPQEIRGIGGRI
ncbi:MAG: pseudouridine synthase [Clostridiales bacterium]|nr:pseudouridine synthase [Clostridiales bacterium]